MDELRQQSTSKAEQRLSNVLKACPQAICGVNEYGVTTFANPACAEILGFETSDALVGENLHNLVHTSPEGVACDEDACSLLKAIRATESTHLEKEIFWTGAGKPCPVEVWVRPKDSDTGPAGAVVSFNGIEEREALQAQLFQVQKLEAIGQLVGGIAHDFNNVLTVILGNLQLLELEVENPKHRKLLDIVIAAAHREGKLVDSLLSFGRRQELQSERFDASELLRGMESLLHRTLGETIAFQTKLSSGCVVESDPAYLQTVIVNLALNARDAMPNGGRLLIETDLVELDEAYAERNPEVVPGAYVRITVTDTGQGIPAEILDRVFEPFFSTKAPDEGTGMGLAMVHGFVKQSGGHIKIYSEEDRGTSVKIYLRLLRELAVAAHSSGVHDEALRVGSELVLLVEDDEIVLRTGVGMLESLGYRVLVAHNGPEALRVLKENADIDLLFSDVVMPKGMTGPELARHARADYPHLEVLLTSGYPGEVVDTAGHSRLRKPYSRSELASAIRSVLDNKDP